jgi:hypothetical protein
MRAIVTYDYGDMRAEWDEQTGVILLFSQDGERLGSLPGLVWTQQEAEQLLRQEIGYVPDEIRALYFSFP